MDRLLILRQFWPILNCKTVHPTLAQDLFWTVIVCCVIYHFLLHAQLCLLLKHVHLKKKKKATIKKLHNFAFYFIIIKILYFINLLIWYLDVYLTKSYLCVIMPLLPVRIWIAIPITLNYLVPIVIEYSSCFIVLGHYMQLYYLFNSKLANYIYYNGFGIINKYSKNLTFSSGK